MYVSSTFASPIEKPATSALRRIRRENRKHRGKRENSGFSPALQKDQFSLKISPKDEKTVGDPVGGEFSKWWA